MHKAVLFTTVLLSLAFTASDRAAEPPTQPLVGTWQLDHQELNGQKRETEPLTLRITPDGDKFIFSFSVLVNNIDFVSMTYTAKLDGTEADIKNARGEKVGTVQITIPTPSHYTLLLKSEKHPETTVHLTVSADGKTLTSESNSGPADHTAHLVQSFLRH